jgi:hypothetical protein
MNNRGQAHIITLKSVLTKHIFSEPNIQGLKMNQRRREIKLRNKTKQYIHNIRKNHLVIDENAVCQKHFQQGVEISGSERLGDGRVEFVGGLVVDDEIFENDVAVFVSH